MKTLIVIGCAMFLSGCITEVKTVDEPPSTMGDDAGMPNSGVIEGPTGAAAMAGSAECRVCAQWERTQAVDAVGLCLGFYSPCPCSCFAAEGWPVGTCYADAFVSTCSNTAGQANVCLLESCVNVNPMGNPIVGADGGLLSN